MGNFENDVPTDALIRSIASVTAWLRAQGATAGLITGPHKNAPGNATACCGRNLIARIGDINAMASGGVAPGPAPGPGGDDLPADKDFVDRLVTDEGTWDLQYDGGVKTIRGPFYGSYFSLPANVRNDPSRRFRVIAAPADGKSKGYDLVSTKGESYGMRTRQ